MKRKKALAVGRAVSDEFIGVDLGDKRLDQRASAIVERLALAPSASFPAVMVTQREQEAFYRFLRNEKTTLAGLLRPHATATALRAKQAPLVVVAHDTTEISFKGRSELYELRAGTFGFGIHLSLAISFADVLCPLGVLGASILSDAKSNRGRWLDQALKVDAELSEQPERIHVMDREADVYSLFAGFVAEDVRFVVRSRHDRLLERGEQERTLLEQLERHSSVLASREVGVSARRRTAKTAMPDEKKARPPRKSRQANLTVSACTVVLPRPQRQAKSLPKSIQVNVVHARELNPPHDSEPIDWLLTTTEPIDTEEDLLNVLDFYRARWTIEEYFKALKTGCAYEARQLEQVDTFSTALGLFIPIAWQLLLIKSHSRLPDVAAQAVMAPRQLFVLQALCAQNHRVLPTKPTARDVVLGLALLGGHIKQNGEPGWTVLWRGFKKVLEAELVLEATEKLRKDAINA